MATASFLTSYHDGRRPPPRPPSSPPAATASFLASRRDGRLTPTSASFLSCRVASIWGRRCLSTPSDSPPPLLPSRSWGLPLLRARPTERADDRAGRGGSKEQGRARGGGRGEGLPAPEASWPAEKGAVIKASGMGNETYFPPSLHYIPPAATHADAVEEALVVNCGETRCGDGDDEVQGDLLPRMLLAPGRPP